MVFEILLHGSLMGDLICCLDFQVEFRMTTDAKNYESKDIRMFISLPIFITE